MKKNPYIASVEKLFIDLYDKRELNETVLKGVLKEMHDCYVDPDQTEGLEAHDGKKFKELVCYIMQPLTHLEIMENSRKIDEDSGYIWENLKNTDTLFDYLWYCELDMADSEEEAESRPICDEHMQDNKPSSEGKYDAIGDFNVKEYVERPHEYVEE